MSMPFSPKTCVTSPSLPGMFSMNTEICLINIGLPPYNLRLSMIRWALPSLRAMVLGLTRWTLAPMPNIERSWETHLLFQGFHGADIIGEHLLTHLYVDIQCIRVIFPANDDLIIGCDVLAADLQEHLFNLRGEDVDAADDEHVVRAAHRLSHSDMGSSAGAGRTVQNTDVTGPVTEQGKGLFR